jgi:amidase
MDDIANMDATAQAELVRKGDVSAAELVEAAIVRAEKVNPGLNAIVTPMYDLARSSADNVDPEAPFAGVPFLLKDLLAEYAGVPMSEGSAFLKGRYVPDHDSELVIRQKRAGLITIAKTNTPEFGLLPTTESLALGRCRNPWDPAHTAGGSSGGSAAAVAAGVTPMAHANDGGGSIRIPASCCGLFGLKPTRGRNPLGPFYGDIGYGIAAEHAVTRSVRDSARLLDATSGPDLGAPYIAPQPERPFADEVGADPGPLRIAVTTTALNGAATHDDCIKATWDAARLCQELGHEIVEAEVPLDRHMIRGSFSYMWAAFAGWAVEYWERVLDRKVSEGDLEPATFAYYRKSQEITAARYLLAVTDAQTLSRQMASFFQDYDLLLTPTLSEPPCELGVMDSIPDDPLAGMRRSADFAGFTAIANVTGQPAMSVPLHWNGQGLPIGLQFIGRYGDEATLFRLAAQLEKARPWADRIPAINAMA